MSQLRRFKGYNLAWSPLTVNCLTRPHSSVRHAIRKGKQVISIPCLRARLLSIVFICSLEGHHYSGRTNSQEGRRLKRVCLPTGATLHFLCHVESWSSVRVGWPRKDGGIHERQFWTWFAIYCPGVKRHHIWVPCQRRRLVSFSFG